MFWFLSQGYNSAKRLDTVQMKVRSKLALLFIPTTFLTFLTVF